jgi:ring-1,2-phenylacetyl-CoA epoxidase subunit PaaB
MALSGVRARIPEYADDAVQPDGGDPKPYEVFIQLTRGQPHSHAGTVDAADDKMALEYARKHYGRDQECVHMWVVPREAIIGTGYDKDLIWPLTDQGYRLARGYTSDVRRKWEQFRSKKDVDEYQKEDIKEAF